MFEQSGFEGASLGDIVEGAGTTKGALYFHFRSKDELARVVIEEQHRTSIASVRAIAETGASPLRQLVMLCHEIARQIVDDPVVRAGMRLTLEFRGSNEPGQPYLEWISSAQAIVELGIGQGEIVDSVDPATLARFVIGSFTGVQLVSQVLTLRADIEQRVDDMWEFLLPAIATSADPAELSTIRATRWTAPAESGAAADSSARSATPA